MWRVPRFGKGERKLKAGKDYRAAELESAGEGGGGRIEGGTCTVLVSLVRSHPTVHPVNALPFSIREVARTTVIALDA